MTTDDRFGPTLARWLDEEAEHRVPGHLAEVLVQTAATRQRPWWSSLERLLPMTTTTLGGRVAAPRPVLVAAALVALLAAVVGLALFAGRPAPTIPIAPPSNGRIVAVDGTSLVTFAPDGTDRRVVLDLPTGAIPTLAVSPDGTRVAYALREPTRVEVARISDGHTTTIPVEGAQQVGDEYIGWSPDGRGLAFSVLTGAGEALVIAAADGSSTEFLSARLPTLDAHFWQPTYSPDGTWIAFIGNRDGVAFNELFVVHPDGTGLRALETASVDEGDGGGPVWSPDRAVHRIAYQTFTGDALHLRVFDLDTESDHEVAGAFWPSWSPDGTKLSGCCASIWSIDDVLAGTPHATTTFGQWPEGGCSDFPDWSGRGICSPATWSPDGRWMVAGDISGKDLVLAPVDGSSAPVRIPATAGVTGSGFRIPLGWQPVWP